MPGQEPDAVRISIVVPVYSGAAFLAELISQIDKLRQELARQSSTVELLEAVFVLDEPVDDSAAILQARQAEFAWLRTVELSRNFGQHNATIAGILHSSGDWVVTMDEDLQHPPAAIPKLLATLAERSGDVLYAKPISGTHQNSYRDHASRLAKKSIASVSRNQHVTDFSSFRLIRGQIARAAASVCTDQTYFDMTLLWFTRRISTLPMKLDDIRFKEQKKSGYSLISLLRHAKRMLFSADVRFFSLALVASGMSFLLAVGLLLWVLLSYYLTPNEVATEGWASLMSVNLFFGGTFAILLGLVLEFVRNSLFHGQGKPAFFVVDRRTDELIRNECALLLDLAKRLQASVTGGTDGDG